jgi:branched-chain amino acid transport system substrate-binding protein
MTARVSRRTLLQAGLFGSAAAALGACSTTVGGATLPPGPDLVVGACLELSGNNQNVGTEQAYALSIIRDTINERGVAIGGARRKLRLVLADTQSDPVRAKKVMQNLIDNPAVSAVVGTSAADTSTAVAAVAQANAMPMLSLSAADSIVTPVQDRSYVFKLGPNASDVANMLAAMMKTRRHRRIAVLYADDGHGVGGRNAMRIAADHTGLTVVKEIPLTASGRLTGYTNQANAVKAAKVDAVVIWAVAPNSGMVARALRERHSTAPFRGELFFDSGAASDETMASYNRAAVVDSYLVSPKILDGSPLAITTPAAQDRQDFYTHYVQAHGVFSSLAAFGGDALKLIVNAAQTSGSTDRKALREALESGVFEGLAGTYAFNTIYHGGVDADMLAVFAIKPSGWLEITA